MDAEVGLVDHASQRKTIEELHEEVVNLLVVDIQTLDLEVVLLSHGPRLVVSSEEVDACRVLDLDGHQEGHYLQGLEASVDVVPQKDNLLVDAALVEQLDDRQYFEEVVQLPMDVAHNRHWVVDSNHIGLIAYHSSNPY